MLNNNLITEVGVTAKLIIYDSAQKTKDELEKILAEQGRNVRIGEPLKGGVVSQVYNGIEAEQPVVIKYTCDTHDADPTVYFMPHETQYVDNQLLQFLAEKSDIRVPDLYYSSDSIPLSVMEDLRASGYELLSQQLLSGKLPVTAAAELGRDIANTQLALASHPKFRTALSGPQLYYSRGQELRQAYHNGEGHYEKLYNRFITVNQQLAVVDSHPKNAFTDDKGNVAWIDFGCSAWCDRDFALPNFLSHIAIYCLAGYVGTDLTRQFITDAVEAYKKVFPLDEESFCEYFAAEVIHRWSGKWIDGIDTLDQKLTLLRFGMQVFDDEISSIDEMLNIFADTEPALKPSDKK